jgi:hypothetical protein
VLNRSLPHVFVALAAVAALGLLAHRWLRPAPAAPAPDVVRVLDDAAAAAMDAAAAIDAKAAAVRPPVTKARARAQAAKHARQASGVRTKAPGAEVALPSLPPPVQEEIAALDGLVLALEAQVEAEAERADAWKDAAVAQEARADAWQETAEAGAKTERRRGLKIGAAIGAAAVVVVVIESLERQIAELPSYKDFAAMFRESEERIEARLTALVGSARAARRYVRDDGAKCAAPRLTASGVQNRT